MFEYSRRILWTILCLFFAQTAPLYCCAYAEAEQIVSFATSEREPYIGVNLPDHGYVCELVTEAFQRAGYRVNITFYPWARAVRNVQKGTQDGLLPVYYDDALTGEFAFSDPFPGGKIGLLKRKSTPAEYVVPPDTHQTEALRYLQSYVFGVVRGSVNTPEFDAADFLKKDMVTTDMQNVLKLFKGRVDFVVIDKYTAADLMVNKLPHTIGQLEFMNPPLAEKSFHIAFSKNSPGYQQRLADFNRGLREMIADQKVEKILYKHGLLETAANTQKEKKIIRIGTVDNPEMMIMQRLSKEYETLHPDVKLEWKTLDENILRLRLLSDLAISDGQFDIMTIGIYETPIWAKNGWLVPLSTLPEKYDLPDVLHSVRDGVSYNGVAHALPFYAESIMTFYRKDLFAQAGLTMPEMPTYADIKRFAAAIHNPERGVYGMCLRGKPGWGENMAYVSTLVNTYGGRWFDQKWNPTIKTQEWRDALTLYTDLARYSPPTTPNNGFTENLTLFANGHCGIWIDATVAAGVLFDPRKSQVSASLGFASAPIGAVSKDSPWLWIWALAIPVSSKVPDEALKFITWATSKDYINLVAQREGWVAVPPGTRHSTYLNPAYRAAAPFSEFVFNAIRNADITHPSVQPVPYIGIQYVGIPEFPAIGTQIGQKIAWLLTGDVSVEQTLTECQRIASDQMRASGYIKE
ncbi:ABC-type sugar transport system, periplasmic component [Candidatus Moduliflexus flocculans]|uniref:ABC-type sugar transport system, periplasmic component n=1 Tax=Candidatus Moduliflexus flocculans TaxID=1499966 RepID=A0A0S6VRM3_9BACT|nr:ABC-type sugar transport system, periplasmic component [Candidatus Moduliflexus flocculans]